MPADHLRHVRWNDRPALRRPVLIAAFEGWNDAGSAATTAAMFLAESWGAAPFAEIDPEEFMDFSSSRPVVGFDDEGDRVIAWPSTTLSFATVRDDLDVIICLGTEPQLRWRTFCEQITGLIELFDVRMVVTLGALLADVPHTRPTSVFGAAYDDDVADDLDLVPSTYEGPTGIVGVLHDAVRQLDVPSASLWAAVPAYVSSATSPKAALALVERAARLLGTSFEADDLAEAAAEYENQIDAVVADDDDSATYVTHLEQQWDAERLETDDPEALMHEIETFLRNQRD